MFKPTLDFEVREFTDGAWGKPMTIKMKVPSNKFMRDWLRNYSSLEADPENPGETKSKDFSNGDPFKNNGYISWLIDCKAIDELFEVTWDNRNVISPDEYKTIISESDQFIVDILYGDPSTRKPGLVRQSELNRHNNG